MTAAFWPEQTVIVTGGAGFLGRYVVEELRANHVARIIIPRRAMYDLREQAAVAQLYDDHPDATMVIHLAANVGGIGINREHPGLFFYDNHHDGHANVGIRSPRKSIDKFVGVGTVCSYPKFAPVPFKEDDLWNGYPEETNAPYGLGEEDAAWCRARLIAKNTAITQFIFFRSTCTDRMTNSTWSTRTSFLP